jgi:tRNA A37 threonylcarbamoyladenosine synthetase subunit TsaC/SUA5/YrdC
VVQRAAESRAWDLGEAADSIALRIPAHPLALAILAGTGPLAATSANRTGEPPASACAELELLFADHADVIVCEDERPPGRASTVVDLTGDETRVIRVGEVDEERLRRFISGEHPLLDSGPFQR